MDIQQNPNARTAPQSETPPALQTTLEADRQPEPMTPAEQAQEARLLRRMQMMLNMVMQTIAQDGSLTIDEASQMVADARQAALSMFPGKELAYELIWRPRFRRLMRDRFRLM